MSLLPSQSLQFTFPSLSHLSSTQFNLVSLHHRSQDFHYHWVTPPLNEGDCQDYIDRCQQEDFEGLLICHVTNDRIIGVANFSQIFY
jgi:[ribosomal protein S5]-alanine N-acetyltransferase